MERPFRKATLSLQSSLELLSLVNNFTEESSKAFGLGHKEALKLALASEEVFTYLCRVEKAQGVITIEAASFIYYVQVSFIFDGISFDPWAFNLTARIAFDDETSLDSLELLIASRSVDRFQIYHKSQGRLELVLVKERSYPEISFDDPLKIPPVKDFTVTAGGPEQLRLLSHQIAYFCPPYQYPPDFRFAGKMVDMVKSGEYSAMVAADSQGQISGGVLWSRSSEKSFEFFGPYVFNKEPQVSEALMDALIGALGKTDAVCLTSKYATPELPAGYFELLGFINICLEGKCADLEVHYRQLKEDLGCQVWAHPELADFLKGEYDRLFFARELMTASDEGEERGPHSVFSANFLRPQGTVTIRPVWDGVDAAENIARHVKIFTDENIPNVFFEIDLTFMWQANLVPHLLAQNFRPRLILPYTSRTDKVVFQLVRDPQPE